MEVLIIVFFSLAVMIIALAGSEGLANLWEAWRRKEKKGNHKDNVT
jgi:hypothetical protein